MVQTGIWKTDQTSYYHFSIPYQSKMTTWLDFTAFLVPHNLEDHRIIIYTHKLQYLEELLMQVILKNILHLVWQKIKYKYGWSNHIANPIKRTWTAP